jgi:hypothetical protein
MAEIHMKWDWKAFWIVILILLIVAMSLGYSSLEEEYKTYQQNSQKQITALQLDLTKASGDIKSNYDCYERGTKECYDIGSVDCFTKGSIGEAKDKLDEFLLTHDCYERGSMQCYDKSLYCYDKQCTTPTCNEGYSLRCFQN